METIEELQRSILELDAEVMVLQELLASMFFVHPNQSAVLAKFQEQIEEMTRDAPPGMDPERIVEFRARATQTLLILSKMKPT